MMLLSRRIGGAGVVLCLALFVGPQAEGSHLNAVASPTAAASSIPASERAGGKLHIAAYNADVRFVNRLLQEENVLIEQSTNLISREVYLQRHLTNLEAIHPVSPQQERLLQGQIHSTSAMLASSQHNLLLNSNHLAVTVPGLENSIALGLNQIQALAPYCPQAIRYVAVASVTEQRNANALEKILMEFPASP